MLRLRLVEPMGIVFRGQILTLPVGRCLEVVSAGTHSYEVMIDEIGEHVILGRHDTRFVIDKHEDSGQQTGVAK